MLHLVLCSNPFVQPAEMRRRARLSEGTTSPDLAARSWFVFWFVFYRLITLVKSASVPWDYSSTFYKTSFFPLARVKQISPLFLFTFFGLIQFTVIRFNLHGNVVPRAAIVFQTWVYNSKVLKFLQLAKGEKLYCKLANMNVLQITERPVQSRVRRQLGLKLPHARNQCVTVMDRWLNYIFTSKEFKEEVRAG